LKKIEKPLKTPSVYLFCPFVAQWLSPLLFEGIGNPEHCWEEA